MKSPATAKRSSRAKGRPDATDGVGRDALLTAAIEELRSTTPEALTLAGVAARAGVHPALIRYYFGSKDGLLMSVAQQLVEGEHDTVRPKLEGAAPLGEKLTQRLRGMIDLTEANPHFHRLVLDKIYGQSSENPGGDLLSRVTSRGMKLTVALLHDNATVTARPIDPRFLHVAMIGLTEFFVTAKPLLRELFGEDANFEDLKERYVSFVRDLILVGVTEPGPGDATVTGDD